MSVLLSWFTMCLDGTFDFDFDEDYESDIIYHFAEGENYDDMVDIQQYSKKCNREISALLVFNDKILSHVFQYLDMIFLNKVALLVCRFWFIQISNDTRLWTLSATSIAGTESNIHDNNNKRKKHISGEMSGAMGVWKLRDWDCIKPIILNSSILKARARRSQTFMQKRTPRELFILNDVPFVQNAKHFTRSAPQFKSIFPIKFKVERPMLDLNFNVVVLGQNGSGKTTLVNVMRKGAPLRPAPSVNFSISTIPVTYETNLTLLDKGETNDIMSEKISVYVESMDGLIYIIDSSSCTDYSKLSQAFSELFKYMNPRFQDKNKPQVPILLLCNKSDTLTWNHPTGRFLYLESIRQYLENQESPAMTNMLSCCPLRIHT